MRVLLVVFALARAQDLTSNFDVKTLSELPLEKLLSVRSSFDAPVMLEAPPTTPAGDQPSAMALRRSKTKMDERGGWDDEKGSSKKGINSIFQMSVTTLAFLAFGGYLLCLVVQSLKDKGGKKVVVIVPMASSTMAPVTMMTRRRRRRRPVRVVTTIRRRPIYTRVTRDVGSEDEEDEDEGPGVDMAPNADPEKMFDALLALSEAYTKYHTVDYRGINSTMRRFK